MRYHFQLGNLLASVVLSAFKNGLDSEKFHIVGHSLGAQMAGMIGRKIITQSNQSQKLKRFALDLFVSEFFIVLSTVCNMTKIE